MKNLKVALLQGGMGSERDVSLVTGKAFAKAVEELGYPLVVIDAIEDLPDRLMKERPDVALLALHGKYAEDGTVQGICEYLKIPYSGSGVFASALCMNKYFTKQVLTFHEIPTPEFQLVNLQTTRIEDVQVTVPFPLVVKPSRDGSSVGISICQTEANFVEALREAAKYDREVLIERFISGMEITVPVLDDKALTPIEIVPKQGFYDYQRKYTAGQTEYHLPPRAGQDLVARCQELALRTHKACQARTYSRVDFRVSEDQTPYAIEINTLPGCTPTSLLPKAAAHDGIPFTSLIDTLIRKATLDYEGVR